MINEDSRNEVRILKSRGMSNLELMTRYNITYAELRDILDGGK